MKRDDFDPSFWGPITWKTLFIFALSYYPDRQTKRHFRSFYSSLEGVLPCEKCRKGYKQFLKVNPLKKHLKTREAFLTWLIALYNEKRPPESRIKDLNDLEIKLLKPDKSISDVIRQISENSNLTTINP